MSISMSKGDGVTVLTLTSDPDSPWPPLCQILKNLCYSPVCCSVSQHLRKVQGASQTALGTLQIMVGLLNIGLGAIVTTSDTYPSWAMRYIGYPFWLGGLFIMFGIVSILSERRPSPCLVIVNVILNLIAVPFAITAIVLYSISIGGMYFWNSCERYDYWYSRQTTPSPPAEDRVLQSKCLEAEALLLVMLRSISAVLVVLSVLELCVAISSAVLGIKALKSTKKGQNQNTDEPELYEPLLEEAPTKPSA